MANQLTTHIGVVFYWIPDFKSVPINTSDEIGVDQTPEDWTITVSQEGDLVMGHSYSNSTIYNRPAVWLNNEVISGMNLYSTSDNYIEFSGGGDEVLVIPGFMDGRPEGLYMLNIQINLETFPQAGAFPYTMNTPGTWTFFLGDPQDHAIGISGQEVDHMWNSISPLFVPGGTLNGQTLTVVLNGDNIPIIEATASDVTDDTTIEGANDDDFFTRWSALGDSGDKWWQADLGSSVDINGVKIAFFKGNTRVYSFDIQISDDGNNWDNVFDDIKTSSGTTTELETFPFTANARYVRYVGYGNSANGYNSFFEFDVMGSSSDSPYILTDAEYRPIVEGGGGVFWNEQLRLRWADRAENGPFKSVGDAPAETYGFGTTSPGDWDRMVAYKDEFMANPGGSDGKERQFDKKVGRFWWLSDGPGLGGHVYEERQPMMGAAMYSLVMQDEAVAEAVKDEFFNYVIPYAVIDPANTEPDSMGRPIVNIDKGYWWHYNYLSRCVTICDLISWYTTDAEKTQIRDWLVPWCELGAWSIHDRMDNLFPNRLARDYSVKNSSAASPNYFTEYTHKNAAGDLINLIPDIGRKYNNRKYVVACFLGWASCLLGESGEGSYLDHCKLFLEEWLKYSQFPDGTSGEYERCEGPGENKGNPIKVRGYRYYGLMAGVTANVMFAAWNRFGDTELLNYSTRDGLFGTECGPGDPDKTFKTAMSDWITVHEGGIDRYNDSFPVAAENRIGGVYENVQHWHDVSFFAPNDYWRDATLDVQIRRKSATSLPYPYSGAPASVGEFFGKPSGVDTRTNGAIGNIPGELFMFAGLEDLV